MPTTTEIDNLLHNSRCLDSCIPDGMKQSVMIYLMDQLANHSSDIDMSNSTDPFILMRQASCMRCIPQGMQNEVIIYLLDQLASNCSGVTPATCAALSGAVDPTGVATPTFIGQLYIQNPGPGAVFWRSTGLTSADWTLIAGAAADVFGGNAVGIAVEAGPNNIDTQISFPVCATSDGLGLFSFSVCTSIDFPLLTSMAGGLFISDFPLLTSVSMPNLDSVAGVFEIDADMGPLPLLTTLSFPSLVTIAGDTLFAGNAALSSFSAPNWLPADGPQINFSGCALNTASIALVLRRMVLAANTTTPVDFTGGTNASHATWTVQALADEATLNAAGCPIIANP